MQIVTINDNDKLESSIAVGIDFGTTNSIIAISKDHKVRFFFDEKGRDIIPSQDLSCGIKSIKRLIGKSSKEIIENNALFRLCNGLLVENSDIPKLKLGDEDLFIHNLVTKIFAHLKTQAESSLGKQIDKVVVSVPAYFGDTERGQVMLAARMAGFEILRLLAEPTAAAYAYGFNKKAIGCYMVYDLGGGTFDVSILNMVSGIMQVIATSGDNMLGGDDFDNLIADYIKEKYQLTLDMGIIVRNAKDLKEKLTYETEASAIIESINVTITKTEIETILKPLVLKTISIAQKAIRDASDIKLDGIILVGGPTRMPIIKKLLADKFMLPVHNDIDPDKAVAIGAAMQAENLTSRAKNLIVDVLPLSLGLELYGGLTEKIILRNTPLPFAITKEFTTQADNQTSMIFHILQGERELASDCKSLARFELSNIPPMKAGLAKIAVSFSIDADGILSVTAQDKRSNIAHTIEINPTYSLSQKEIDEQLQAAYSNARLDHEARLLKIAELKAESTLRNVEKILYENKDLTSSAEYNEILKSIQDLKSLLNSGDKETILLALGALEKKSQNIIQAYLNNNIQAAIVGQNITDK